jgi:two-component system, LuxR family, response regulator FixJ
MPAPDAVIHVIDDDEAVRQALAFLLTSSGFAVRVYGTAMAFLEAIPSLQPGCVITDVRMPVMSGLELQRQLKRLKVGLPVIVMTGHGDVPLAVEAMKAGAADFIEKPFHDEVLIAAIRIALDSSDENLTRKNELEIIRTRLKALTAREIEVLDALVSGNTNKAIAFDLKISARTVEVHRANLMTKMGASNLSSLVRMVFAVRGL